jgi:hypothetical protein
MSLTKAIIAMFITILSLIVMLFLTDLIAKKYLELGEPIVYDAHPLWGYSPRANRQYTRFDGDVVSINGVGTRGQQVWRADGANILFLGDSVTYGGSYIGDHQTFAYLSCSGVLNWNCHNAGVNAYGILNMVARSRYDYRINDAPIRVFTFISKDFYRGLQNSGFAHFILREAPDYFSGLWEILNFVASSINPKIWFGKQSDIDNKELDQQSMLVAGKFALDVLISELNRLETLGIEFLIVHSPSVDELNNPELIRDNYLLAKLQRQFKDEYVRLDAILREPFINNSEGIYKDNVHYEERGHQIIGDHLAQRIEKLTN